jgi:cysteine synthase A
MANKFANILGTIGATPVVKLQKLAPHGCHLYAKLEAFNPMGSVKDRLALGVIEQAERSGELQPGQTVIEATSGNTGIGLAMVCAQKGYPLVVTMAENFSVERRKMMRFMGAKVVLTPAAQKGTGMLAKAVELAEAHGWYLCRQFDNPANADIHSLTTATEILNDFRGEPLDYWVTGFGTGGTLKGVARVLRQYRPQTRIVVCEPDNSALLGSGTAQQRDADGAPAASHPAFRPHLMQGWTPDFISSLTEDAVNAGWIDQILPINGADALRLSRELAQREGIFTGISGGATLAGALQLCAQAEPGATVLCMLPDTGERYLSTPLFSDIASDMTAEEIEISRSTTGFRFDIPTPVTPVPHQQSQQTTKPTPKPEPAADGFVNEVISDPSQPVVMFALEWCEFCWSVRNFFAAGNISYRAIDLDSVTYKEGDRGALIRSALNARTGSVTIPQIFVGGQFIGGCTEVFDAWNAGELQTLLNRSDADYEKERAIDPYSFLPTWLQPR